MFKPTVVGIQGLSKKLTAISVKSPTWNRGLMRAALHLQGMIAKSARVKTGNLRGSWTAAVPRIMGNTATIGSDVKYAPFVGRKGEPTGYKFAGVEHVQSVLDEEADKISSLISTELKKEWNK